MVVSPRVTDVAMSIVSGAIKLNRRLDEIMAEEVAVHDGVALPLPNFTVGPFLPDMQALLQDFLDGNPDLPGKDRRALGRVLAAAPTRSKLLAACKKYGLMDLLQIMTIKPDEAARAALRSRARALTLEESELQRITFFVAAGPDRRQDSLGFRLGATVLDVLAEFGAANTRLVVEHESTRKLVETVLTKFSEAQVGTMSGWGQVLQQALRVTVNAALDQREVQAGNRKWLEGLLSVVARVRDETGDDDFIFGLLRGEGFNVLVRGVLAEAGDVLSRSDDQAWEAIVGDVLTRASKEAARAPGFGDYFNENWHTLVSAGLGSLREHGQALLGDEAILEATLHAAVGALADATAEKRPTGETLAAVVRSAVSVFADPGIVGKTVREPWLRDMIASVTGIVRDEGLRAAFTQPALERYARDTLETLSHHPDTFGANKLLVQEILSGILSSLADAPSFAVGSLANAVVEGALAAIAQNPRLIDNPYAPLLGALAADLAERVTVGGISTLEAEALISIAADALASNEFLFLRARVGLARTVVDAVLDSVEASPVGLLNGGPLIATVQGVLNVVGARGLGLPESAGKVSSRLGEVMTAGLALAGDELGHRLAQSDVPAVLAQLVEAVASRRIPKLDTPEFEEFFGQIVEAAAVHAA